MTTTHADRTRSTRPIRKRPRVSSHDLYQSMSVLRGHGFEEDVFQRDGCDVDRSRIPRARFGDDRLGAGAGQDAEHATLTGHARNPPRVELRVGRVAVENQLNAP